ncbi:MAG: radical SAM protein [Bacteroidota bacterium]
MKILLVAPCNPDEQRHNTMGIPQLTLSLIAALTPPEHEVEVCEEVYGQQINFDGGYDVVGITIMTQTCIRGYQVANEFRKRNVKVVFGGIHATCIPEEAIRFGDAVVIGEAEGGLWAEVLTDIKNNKLRKFYKLDQLPDLQNYVAPRRDLVNCKTGKFTPAPIETTRGCPYNCDFCTVSRFFGTKQRHKNIRDIIKEAESAPGNALFILDDNVSGDKKFARELFTELAPLKKIWVGQAAINISADEELMKLAEKSGCKALLVGFESMTDSGLNSYRKTLKTIEANVEAVKRLRDYGILTMASLIFGLDTDKEEVFDLSYEFIMKSQSAFFQSCVVTPYPGTPLFEKLKSEGRILSDNWSHYDATKVLIEPKHMTSEELLEGVHKIQKSIYSRSSIYKRALPNVMLGFTEALFYMTLNRGYRKRNNQKKLLGVQSNPEGYPVDFDVTKYIQPYADSTNNIEIVGEEAIKCC